MVRWCCELVVYGDAARGDGDEATHGGGDAGYLALHQELSNAASRHHAMLLGALGLQWRAVSCDLQRALVHLRHNKLAASIKQPVHPRQPLDRQASVTLGSAGRSGVCLLAALKHTMLRLPLPLHVPVISW